MGTKQLHSHQRMLLQACILKGLSIRDTCLRLKTTRFTIYRELHRHVEIRKRKWHGCAYCSKFLVCKGNNRTSYISCENYVPIECSKLKRFPYVCNCCRKKSACMLTHRYYDFEKASEIAKQKRTLHHQKIKVTSEQLSLINRRVCEGLRNGQSLNHIYISNKDIHFVSQRTIRRYLYSNKFEIGPSELPRYVRFNHNPAYKNHYQRPSNLKDILGRTYRDYKEFVLKNKPNNVVQLDSVIGTKKDSRCILTIYLTKTHFMFGILIDKGVPVSVNTAINNLRKKLGSELWKKGFQILLTDNGSEFNRLPQIEFDENGEQVCKVFYCDPYSSFQKGACERNHEFIRYIISKGKTLDSLNQTKVNMMFSHINSYKRSSINEKTPFELTKEFLGSKFLECIEITEVDCNQVNLKSNLLK